MKRTILFFIVLAFLSSLFCQSELPYIQDFDAMAQMPPGWHGGSNVGVNAAEGVNGSNAIRADLKSFVLDAYVIAPVVGPILPNSIFRFDYRITNHSSTEFPGPPTNLSVCTNIRINVDGNAIYTINRQSHQVSQEFRTLTFDLGQFVGKSIELSIVASDATGDFIMNIDNWYVYVPQNHDLIAMSLKGPQLPSLNSENVYSVEVFNLGSQSASDFMIMLMLDGESFFSELAFIEGCSLLSEQKKVFEIPWTPSFSGNHHIYGILVYDSDQTPHNNQTSPINIFIPSANSVVSFVGDKGSPDMLSAYPFCYSFDSNIAQSIYLSDELPVNDGYITHVAYSFQGTGDIDLDVPVRLYIAHTELDAFSRGVWIGLDEFTLVYEGPISVQNTGFYDVLIELDEPFQYTDGNIAVMSMRPYVDGAKRYNLKNAFQATVATESNRTIRRNLNAPMQVDDLDWGMISSHVPNTSFVITTSNISTLSGKVTNNGTALENVRLVINQTVPSLLRNDTDQTNLETFTNSEGEYYFTIEAPATVNLTASKEGFLNAVVNDIIIGANEDIVKDIQMNEIPDEIGIISGIVTCGELPLEGVQIVIAVDAISDRQETFTNSEGEYTFSILTPATITITASKETYQDAAIENIQIYASDEITQNISMVLITNVVDISDIPFKTGLRGNYPNPFNPSTTIEFDVNNNNSPHIYGGGKGGENPYRHSSRMTQGETHIRIDIYNIRGQMIRTLGNGLFSLGTHKIDWDGNDTNGNPVSSGIYFYQLKSENVIDTKKMILMK